MFDKMLNFQFINKDFLKENWWKIIGVPLFAFGIVCLYSKVMQLPWTYYFLVYWFLMVVLVAGMFLPDITQNILGLKNKTGKVVTSENNKQNRNDGKGQDDNKDQKETLNYAALIYLIAFIVITTIIGFLLIDLLRIVLEENNHLINTDLAINTNSTIKTNLEKINSLKFVLYAGTLAAIGFGVQAYVAYVRTITMKRSDEQFRNVQNENIRESIERRFHDSIRLLGDKSESVRSGALYLLFNIVDTALTDSTIKVDKLDEIKKCKELCEPVINVICAHIRQLTNSEEYLHKQYPSQFTVYRKSKSDENLETPSDEVKLIFQFIVSRSERIVRLYNEPESSAKLNYYLPLSGSVLRRLFLVNGSLCGIDFTGADLSYSSIKIPTAFCNFNGANLSYVSFNLISPLFNTYSDYATIFCSTELCILDALIIRNLLSESMWNSKEPINKYLNYNIDAKKISINDLRSKIINSSKMLKSMFTGPGWENLTDPRIQYSNNLIRLILGDGRDILEDNQLATAIWDKASEDEKFILKQIVTDYDPATDDPAAHISSTLSQ